MAKDENITLTNGLGHGQYLRESGRRAVLPLRRLRDAEGILAKDELTDVAIL